VLLLGRYGGRATRTRRAVTWLGDVTPAPNTHTYELLLDHQPPSPPLIYVVQPQLEVRPGEELPHVYPLNTLCLYFGKNEWNASRPLADLVGWACEWLFFYEIWLATGEWFGGGVHLDGVANNRRTRRRNGHRRGRDDDEDALELKRDRLIRALKRMHPGERQLEALLQNAWVTSRRP
jgi:hypothetical protein